MSKFFSGPTTFTSPAQIQSNGREFASALGSLVSQNNNKRTNRQSLINTAISEGSDLAQEGLKQGWIPGVKGQGQRDSEFISRAYKEAYDPETGSFDYDKIMDLSNETRASAQAARQVGYQSAPRTTFNTSKDRFNITEGASDRNPDNQDIENDYQKAYKKAVGIQEGDSDFVIKENHQPEIPKPVKQIQPSLDETIGNEPGTEDIDYQNANKALAGHGYSPVSPTDIAKNEEDQVAKANQVLSAGLSGEYTEGREPFVNNKALLAQRGAEQGVEKGGFEIRGAKRQDSIEDSQLRGVYNKDFGTQLTGSFGVPFQIESQDGAKPIIATPEIAQAQLDYDDMTPAARGEFKEEARKTAFMATQMNQVYENMKVAQETLIMQGKDPTKTVERLKRFAENDKTLLPQWARGDDVGGLFINDPVAWTLAQQYAIIESATLDLAKTNNGGRPSDADFEKIRGLFAKAITNPEALESYRRLAVGMFGGKALENAIVTRQSGQFNRIAPMVTEVTGQEYQFRQPMGNNAADVREEQKKYTTNKETVSDRAVDKLYDEEIFFE